MSLALCPQVVSQAPQHFRFSEKQATCEGCFARQTICSVITLHSGMSRAVHTQEFSKVDVDHKHITVPIPLFTFCSKLTEPVRMMACVVWLSPLETIQRRASVTCFHLHRKAGGWYRIGFTVFMDGSRILLHSEAPPWLVLWWLSHLFTLWNLAVCCFLEWEAWSLTMFCLLAILDSAVPRFLSVVSHTEKKWIFSFNEEQCMTERGKEFQVTDLMHSADLSPTVLLPILGTQKCEYPRLS